MKGFSFILLLSLILISSCQQTNKRTTLEFDENVKQIIFFSDEKEYQYEAAYYDAILELKKDYPDEVKNMKTINPSISEEYKERFKVEENPTIIVVYKNEIVAKVNGKESVDEIIQPIAKVLSEK